MAPGFNTLREDDDGYDSAEDLDFSGMPAAEASVRELTVLQTYVNSMTFGLSKAWTASSWSMVYL